MKILCTGSTGFLGKNLQEAFKQANTKHEIIYVGSKYNLLEPEMVDLAFNTYKPDIVIHMAAIAGGLGKNLRNPAIMLRDNLLMNINVYDAAIKYKVSKVIALGSICSFPCYCPIPFKEDSLFDGLPEITNLPYGESKRVLYLLGKTNREQYGLNSLFLMPVNLFGVYDNFDLNDSHVIPALINKFVSAVNKGENTVFCWGNGEASREFLFASDCAKAIVKAVDIDYELPINLGTGKEITIRDLSMLIAELTGFKGRIEFTGEVGNGQPRRCLDVSRAKEILSWEAETSLVDGLKETIKWYKEAYGM